MNFSSGSVTVSGKSNLTGTTNFNGATLTVSGSPSSLARSVGRRELNGSGTIFANGGISINASSSGNGEVQLSQATLVNAAGKTATFAGTGYFDISSGATLINSGTFLAQNNEAIFDKLGRWRHVRQQRAFSPATSAREHSRSAAASFVLQQYRQGQRPGRDAGPSGRRQRQYDRQLCRWFRHLAVRRQLHAGGGFHIQRSGNGKFCQRDRYGERQFQSYWHDHF